MQRSGSVGFLLSATASNQSPHELMKGLLELEKVNVSPEVSDHLRLILHSNSRLCLSFLLRLSHTRLAHLLLNLSLSGVTFLLAHHLVAAAQFHPPVD